MPQPVIGILCAQTERPSGAQRVSTVYLNTAYCRAVVEAGGLPLLLPPVGAAAACLLTACDGLLLPGGEDVDPRLYGQESHPLLGSYDRAADDRELALFALARSRSLPVLGICRGMQLVNVALGGTLYQDLSLSPAPPLSHAQRAPRNRPTHRIAIEPGSHLHTLLGTDTAETNSMHHQAVATPGTGLRITAHTAEGIPEAMETADGSILLVQWHPEELVKTVPAMRQLFTALVRRADAHSKHTNGE